MSGAYPRIRELPYREDVASWFEAVRDLPWPVFLDSGGNAGSVDVVAADPGMRLITRNGQTRLVNRTGEHVSQEDPFTLVREALGPRADGFSGVPFPGGAIGYFGYDLGRLIERLPSLARDEDGLPEMCIGLYDWAVVVDHDRGCAWLAAQGRDKTTRQIWDALIDRLMATPSESPEESPLAANGPLSQGLDREAYGEAFRRIQRYIREGDCYQVNFALRFDAEVRGDPWTGYRALRRINPTPFGGFMDYGDFAVLSFSPERFLRLRGNDVETCPIKGTRPRGATPQEDEALRDALVASDKDKAENLMIVDLLRNDLGRVCVPGSIEVDRLFEVESFPTVHHLVSRIRGRLRAGESAPSLLRACFPGGSITGAPKIRAMEIIESLEPQRRGVYCGAIGYIGFDGAMDTNIAIRTLVVQSDRAWFWAGGGIVADSDEEAEYVECLSKAGFLLDYFGD